MKGYTGLSAASIILVISLLQGGDGPGRLRFHAGPCSHEILYQGWALRVLRDRCFLSYYSGSLSFGF